MHPFSFRDSSCDLTDCSEYEISIQTGLDGFSFIIRRLQSGEIVLFKRLPFNVSSDYLQIKKINEAISENEVLNHVFTNTTILFAEPHFSLIPEACYADNLAGWLLTAGLKPGEETESVIIPVNRMNAFLAFSTGRELYNFLTSRFTGASVSHEIYPLIRNILSAGQPVIRFHLHNHWFFAAGFNEGHMEFLNSFRVENDTDLVYFMLSVLEQPELKGLPVTLSGWINPEDQRYAAIKKYIPRADMAVAGESSHVIPTGIPYHFLPGIIVI